MLSSGKDKLIFILSILLFLCVIYITYTSGGKNAGGDETVYTSLRETADILREDRERLRSEVTTLGDIQEQLDIVQHTNEKLIREREEYTSRRTSLESAATEITERMGIEISGCYDLLDEFYTELGSSSSPD